jgi:hypothetical protein
VNVETAIEHEIMIRASEMGHMVHKQHVGLFHPYKQPKTIIRMGLVGMADLLPVVPIMVTPAMVGLQIGLAVNAEVKTFAPGSQMRGVQQTYRESYENRGGIYIMPRSPDEYELLLGMKLDALRAGILPATVQHKVKK